MMKLALPSVGLARPITVRAPFTAVLVTFLLPAYLVVHLVLRLLEGGVLRWDESEQTLFTQRLALGYNDQPPVYTWLLWCVYQVTGVSLLGLYAMKMVVLGSCYLGTFACARRLTTNSQATLATLALLLTPYFAWSVLIDGAHTLFVAAFVPISFWFLLRLLDRPSSAGFALLGLILGLGALAKYSFAILAIVYPLAMLTIPTYRRRLKDVRIAWTILVGALVVAPHAWWILDNWQLIRERPMVRSGMIAAPSAQDRMGSGLVSLGRTTLLSVGSLVAVLVTVFPRSCGRLFTRPTQSEPVRLLGRWLLIVAMMLVMLVLVGVTHFRMHWLIPGMILLPIYVFARFAEFPTEERQRKRFLALVVLAVLAPICIRIHGIVRETQVGGKYWSQEQMHAETADCLKAHAPGTLTIVGDHPVVCGNLRQAIPNAHVVCSYYPAFALPTGEANFIVWDSTDSLEPMPRLKEFLAAQNLHGRFDQVQHFEVVSTAPIRGLRRIGVMPVEPLAVTHSEN